VSGLSARDPLTELLRASPEEQTLSRACAALVKGALGPAQPRWMRGTGVLHQLESAGLAEYIESGKNGGMGGWRLTEAGALRAKRFLAAGRAARKHPFHGGRS
jgi:hypothetical protein